MTYKLTPEQAEIIASALHDQLLTETRQGSQDGSTCYASVTGRLTAIIECLLTGQTHPTIDNIIEQTAFND